MTVCFKLALRPRHQLLHQTRGVKRTRRFKNDTHAPPMFIESFDIIGNRLVGAAMVFVAMRELQERSVKVLDVVFRKRNVAPGIEHQFRCLRVARNLLLVPRSE